MGWITEFMKSHDALLRYTGLDWLDRYVSWPKNTGGRFNTYIDQINEGDYSDDTQLALSVARSTDPDGSVNAAYFLKVELPLWMQYARGAGSTITAAANAASRKSATPYANFFQYRRGARTIDYRQSGANGAAMRVLPLAIANFEDRTSLQTQVWINAISTHGHPRAIVGALLISEAQRRVLAREELHTSEFFPSLIEFVREVSVPRTDEFDQWLRRWNDGDTHDFQRELLVTKLESVEALQIASRSRDLPIEDVLKALGCYDKEFKGSGIATTSAALALFYRYGGNFKACVEHAVNLIGTDTDTIGAMAASLAGAMGGSISLPEDWTVKVQDYNYLNRVAEALVDIGLREATGWELGPQIDPTSVGPESTDLSHATKFTRGQRLVHPIFGRGWVVHVDTQAIRRRSGGTVTLVDVEFDVGQRVRLRTKPRLLEADEGQIAAAKSRMLVQRSVQPRLTHD